MAVLEKLLKTKLPSRDDLSKKLLKGKLFTRRAKPAPEAEVGAPASESPPPAPAEDLSPATTTKAKKPSLAALLQKRKKGTEHSGNGPTRDRIARALRRSQIEAELAGMKPQRIFVSEQEAVPVSAPALVHAPLDKPAEPPLTPPEQAQPQMPAPALLTPDEAEALVSAIMPPREPEAAAPSKPVADPRSAALLALAIEAELDVSAVAERVKQRTGLTATIEEDGRDLRLSFPDMTLIVSQIARPLSEAELLNMLYPDEEEWQAIRARFAGMTRHITVGAVEPAETLHDLRRRAVLIAETVVALLDLMPSCLGVIWPLGASLIDEGDFRVLSLALAEGLADEAEAHPAVEEPKEPAAEPPANAPEPAETPPEAQLHTQAQEVETPRA